MVALVFLVIYFSMNPADVVDCIRIRLRSGEGVYLPGFELRRRHLCFIGLSRQVGTYNKRQDDVSMCNGA